MLLKWFYGEGTWGLFCSLFCSSVVNVSVPWKVFNGDVTLQSTLRESKVPDANALSWYIGIGTLISGFGAWLVSFIEIGNYKGSFTFIWVWGRRRVF